MYINKPRVGLSVVFGGIIIYALAMQYWAMAFSFAVGLFFGFLGTGRKDNEAYLDGIAHSEQYDPILFYTGDELNFSDDLYNAVLQKHFPYFNALSIPDKEKFLTRLKEFISGRTFKIHDTSGFREMPILICATAIQLTFGLEHYLLPQFKFIHVYPEEFVRSTGTIDFLEGNVSGQSINLSWKHFLEGFQYPDDGQNVGLHEMAHALYYQNFVACDNTDKVFCNEFEEFNNYGDKLFEQGAAPANNLYSTYAYRNVQEFWAESIEIFFERPVDMRTKYPTVYSAICDILNQDPANKLTSLRSN